MPDLPGDAGEPEVWLHLLLPLLRLTAEGAWRGGFLVPLILRALLEEGPLAQHPSWEADFEDEGVGALAESHSAQEPKHAQGHMEVTLDVDITNHYYLIVSET